MSVYASVDPMLAFAVYHYILFFQSSQPGVDQFKQTTDITKFLISCVEAFIDLTNPVSSIAKPAAIHMTKKPPIKNSSVLNIK